MGSAGRPAAGDDSEIASLIADLTEVLESRSTDVLQIWTKYDLLKIKRALPYLPYEAWLGLMKTCQRSPGRNSGGSGQSAVRGMFAPNQSREEGPAAQLDDCFASTKPTVWTRTLSKRRALMFLGDMWRNSGMRASPEEHGAVPDYMSGIQLPGSGIDSSTVPSALRPLAYHYNIAFDVIGRDRTSEISELKQLHRDMRTQGIQEDAITFNTLLNGCSRLGAWDYFREIEAHVRKRSAWGITRMDVTTWGTLIQGYRVCKDWAAVDRCVKEASSACHDWHKRQSGSSGGGASGRGVKPTTELWSAIINVYAARDMIAPMLASRQIMGGFGLPMTAYTFAPIFAALHRLRRTLTRRRKDAWPAIQMALSEFEAMRSCQIPPNATIFTNLALTVGLRNPYADSAHLQDGVDTRIHAKLGDVGGAVAQELESMLTRSRDPNVYVALLNLGEKTRALGDIQEIWSALISETQFSDAGAGGPLLTSVTLAAYMNALIGCQQYDKAIAAFNDYAAPPLGGSRLVRERMRIAKPRVPDVDISVYNAAIKAFARAHKHRMCVQVMYMMASAGVQPTTHSVRYSLLPPDQERLQKVTWRFTRPWALSLATAREIWRMVYRSREREWARGPQKPLSGAEAQSSRGQMPVIVNDIAAQFIRIAAYARNVDFGEQVFDALKKEAAHFRIDHGDSSSDDPNIDDPLPEDMQCAPNVYTYTSLITLYSNVVDIASVSRAWAQMLNDGVEPNLHTYTSLVSALHKVAMRKRWKQSREHVESTAEGKSSPYEDDTAFDSRLKDALSSSMHRSEEHADYSWMPTPQDRAIVSVEDWIVGPMPQGDHGPAPEASESPLSLDIPLSTLLLRYHSMRISDTINSLSRGQDEDNVPMNREMAEDIERVMRVCQVVESKGLKPDQRFHAALADFFDTCGDSERATLVRRRMDRVPQ